MGFISEFKAFAMRGNVIDMAVGIIIGGAFGKIVTSLVNDVVMPPIGMLLGGTDFSNLSLVLREAGVDAAGAEIAPVTIGYGLFINTVINFLIIAMAIFLVIKAMNRATETLKKKEEAAPPAPAELSMDQQLLTEIRDLLRARG